ncbi:ABC transporter permease [Clostridium sp. DL1XJH146]
MDSISYYSIFLLSLFIIPILFVNRLLEIKLNKDILISLVRMVIQLSVVGLYLQYIFDLNNPILNCFYMLIMMAVATTSITNSTKLKLRYLFGPIFISIIIPNVLMLLFFNAFVVRIDNILDAKYIITIGGMMLGNVLKSDIMGLMTYYKGIKENKETVYYDLALGATLFQATKPHLKKAVVATIRPTISTMATIGLVSLPGMMTGQILGGSVPMNAILYQIAIMIAIFVTSYFNSLGAILFSQKVMFDERDMLVEEYMA